jgi:hypothetical protein
MTILIEIVCTAAQEKPVQATIEAICRETGDLLIGRRANEQTHEVLLVVQLLQAESMSRHTTDLSHALQQRDIASFRFVSSNLLQISVEPSLDLQEQMHEFPTHSGESWFPAIHNPHQAYVSLSRPLMQTAQAAWLLRHQVGWAYV